MTVMTSEALRGRLTATWRHGDHADLRGVTCDGRLDLRGIDVAGFDLSGASFPQGIDARQARFLGLCWLGGSTFGGAADFAGAAFMNDARFEAARFDTAANFRGAEFRGIGRFDGCRFAEGADFSETVAYGNFSLHEVRMNGPVSFRGGEWLGGLWCQAAALPAETDLSDTQVHGRLWLRGARRGNAGLRAENFGMSFGYAYS